MPTTEWVARVTSSIVHSIGIHEFTLSRDEEGFEVFQNAIQSGTAGLIINLLATVLAAIEVSFGVSTPICESLSKKWINSVAFITFQLSFN